MGKQLETEKEARARAARRALRNAINAKIKADNAKAREERNARRNKAERDPLEYAAQKKRQRENYAAEQGGSVRPYEKIVAQTKVDHEEQIKVRHAKREAKRYADMTPEQRQAKSDAIADEAWQERRRAKGIPEELIQAQLIAHRDKRAIKRAAKSHAAK